MKPNERHQVPGIRPHRAPLFASMWMALFMTLRHEFILGRASR